MIHAEAPGRCGRLLCSDTQFHTVRERRALRSRVRPTRIAVGVREHRGMENILFGLFYLFAIVVVILHFTGWLADRGLEWVVFVTALLVFPVALSPLYL